MRRIVQIIILSLALMLPAVVSAQTGVFKVKKETTTSTPKPVQKQESKPKVEQHKNTKQRPHQNEEIYRRAPDPQCEDPQLRGLEKQRQRSAEQDRVERERYEKEKPNIIENLINNMVYVDGGTFTMGATLEQGNDVEIDEKPSHSVTVSSFFIGKYEVTQAEWRVVMGSNPSRFKGDNLPVEQVSWNDCQEFIRKLNQLTGKKFRLPTEAEWEFAARGGCKSGNKNYSGSFYITDVAWYADNSNNKTHQVGSKRANELGLYDMSGNVWEWCQDWYGKYYYKNSSSTDPKGPYTGTSRVYRGGSWGDNAVNCRVSDRCDYTPDDGFSSLGFRLAL